jgi:hypothetical protein
MPMDSVTPLRCDDDDDDDDDEDGSELGVQDAGLNRVQSGGSTDPESEDVVDVGAVGG